MLVSTIGSVLRVLGAVVGLINGDISGVLRLLGIPRIPGLSSIPNIPGLPGSLGR